MDWIDALADELVPVPVCRVVEIRIRIHRLPFLNATKEE